MILYDSALARAVLSDKRENLMLFGINFTKKKYLEPTKEMEMIISQKQYTECMLLGFLPSIVLSALISWWFLLLIPATYYILYAVEWLLLQFTSSKGRQSGRYRSAFSIEAKSNRHDLVYMRKRKAFAWMKLYAKR